MKVSRRGRAVLASALALAVLAPVSALSTSGVATATDGIFVGTPARQITFENTAPAHVVLGAKASRSTGAAFVGQTGTGPYTITGPGSAYTFETDRDYAGSGDSETMSESLVYANSSVTFTKPAADDTACTDTAGVLVSGCVFLQSSGNITGSNSGYFGSIFGPEVWTEKFTVTEALEVAFRYRVVGTGDDYEMYAYLVDVGTSDYADGTHSIVAHVRGKNQPWKFLTGTIPAAGTYRFRFVNGTYDYSGGKFVGSNTYLDPAFWVGKRNSIAMDSITTKVRGDADQTFPISALATSAGPVFFSVDPATAARCAVGSATRNSDGSYAANVTVKSTGTNGQCTIFAQSANFGEYVPAPQIFRNFNICASNLADGGGHSISGTVAQGERLEFNIGTITSCGDNYNVLVQWQRCINYACATDGDFETVASFNKSGLSTDADAKARLGLSGALVSNMLRVKMTVTDGDNTVVYNSPLVGPVLAVNRTTTTSVAGPVSEPKPFVLPSGDTPRVEPGKAVAYEGGAPVVLTSEPVTVGGVQSVKLGGTSAGGGRFEMTIGGDCPTCAVTQSNTGDDVLGMEQAAAVRVGGYGFGPSSQVNVFVSSTTRLIGFFKADGDGAFLGSVKVPNDLPRGNHTIQVSGFTADNVIRSVSVGITVAKATPKGCRVVKRKGKKPVTVCPKKTVKKVVKKKK